MTQERDRIGEIQDRLRRIETRLTKYMQERGFETQTQKCVWFEKEREIHIPSMDVRLRDILVLVPEKRANFIQVIHQGEPVMNFHTQFSE